MSLIVIEGVDGAGKSTLIEKLRDNDTHIMHKGPMEGNVVAEYINPLLSYNQTHEGLTLCDRWHVGEMVYGPIYRGESKVNPGFKRYIEMFLDSRGALKVILDESLGEIHRRLQERGEDFLDREHVKEVWLFYRMYGADRGYHVLRDPDPDQLLSQAAMLAKLTANLADFPTYVGNTKPDVLLVGQSTTFPAFLPHLDNANELLFASIPDNTRFGVVGLEKHIDHLWNALNGPKVIALGTAAAAFLKENEIPVRATVPHPHEILKYSPSRAEEYGKTITSGVRRG